MTTRNNFVKQHPTDAHPGGKREGETRKIGHGPPKFKSPLPVIPDERIIRGWGHTLSLCVALALLSALGFGLIYVYYNGVPVTLPII
jgi:hypothetical protein